MSLKKVKYIFKKIFIILLIGCFSIFIYKLYEEIKKNTQETNIYGTKLSAKSDENSIIENTENSNTIERVLKSVVGVSKIKNSGSTAFLVNSAENLGLGTGIIVSKQGYILTNYHVAGKENSECYITTENGKAYKAKVVWTNEDIDIAIIKVEIKFESIAPIGNSNEITLGESVYAIGNPIGYEFQRTITAGIISAKDRTIKIKNNDDSYSYMSNLIQTDASINPGNSGGPLINKKGEVIGINSIKITSADGIGFAIPINIVKPIIEKIEENPSFKEAYLGILAYDGSIIAYINEDFKISQGVYIEEVIKGGPAQKSDLIEGDIIVKIDDTNINKMIELQEYIFKKNPEDEIILKILRNGETHNIQVILGEKEK